MEGNLAGLAEVRDVARKHHELGLDASFLFHRRHAIRPGHQTIRRPAESEYR